MRHAGTLLLPLLLLLPAAGAQGDDPVATLTLTVGADRAETMVLELEGLRRLTQYNGICLPAGARESRVYDELGDVQYEAREEDGRRALSFLARGSSVSIDMARAAPDDATHPLYSSDVNFCVPSDSTVEIEVRVPQDHTLFFLSGAGDDVERGDGRIRSSGPLHAFYAYEAPIGARRPMQVVDEGPFRIFSSAPLAPQAQEVASLAAAPYRAALAEAGLEEPFDTLRVLFTADTPQSWEAGHYDGNGFVSVKEEALAKEAREGYPYASVKILVHEAFHAASFPYGRGEVEDTVAWWLEGTARRAERQVDATMPNATLYCEKDTVEVRCASFDDRIEKARLDAAYADGFVFNADWEPSLPQDDDTRSFYYGYSEYLVSSWIERRGEDDYRAAWDEIEGAFLRGEGCPCGDGWIEKVLGAEGLYAPHAELYRRDPAAYDATVAAYVKDQEALDRELAEQANPFSGIPAWGAWGAMAAIAGAAAARRARRG